MLNSSSGHRFKGRARRSDRLELLAGSVERRDLRRRRTRAVFHHAVVVVVRRGREPEDERLTGERIGHRRRTGARRSASVLLPNHILKLAKLIVSRLDLISSRRLEIRRLEPSLQSFPKITEFLTEI